MADRAVIATPRDTAITTISAQLFKAAKIDAPEDYDMRQSRIDVKSLLMRRASSKGFHVALVKLERSLELAEKFTDILDTVLSYPDPGFLTWMGLKLLLEASRPVGLSA